MFALDQRSRTLCVCLALTCFVTAIAATPRAARSAASFSSFVRSNDREPARTTVQQLLIRRDPFAGAPQSELVNPPPLAHAQPHALTVSSPPPAPSTHIAQTAPAERVSAIVTGLHPYALVTDDTTSRIVALGDNYAGVRIVGIALDGLHLGDGRLIPVATSGENAQR